MKKQELTGKSGEKPEQLNRVIKYQKITPEDVLNLMKNSKPKWFYDTIFNTMRIKVTLNASAYSVRRCLKILKDNGLIYYDKFSPPCEKDYESQDCYCDNHLPIWGYRVVENTGQKEPNQCNT